MGGEGERRRAKDGVGCVGTHTVSVVQMAEMDATQKRSLRSGTGREGGKKRTSSTRTHT